MFKRIDSDRKKELISLITGAALYICALVMFELIRIQASSLTRALVYIAIYVFVGCEVILGAVREAKEGEVFSEETLMSIATIGALILREFPEAVAVMLLYRVGEWFADYAVDKSRDSISALTELRPDRARVKRNGNEISIKPEDVEIGETVVVLPGERIPLDGEIISGETTVDTSALTGESLPSVRQEGDEVFSGCVNLSGLIEMRVINSQSDSAVSRILKLTQDAQERKARSETFIERFARIYTPVVIVCAAILGTVPSLISGDWTTWVHRALVFLTVSCPCALVVSVPLTFFCGIGCFNIHFGNICFAVYEINSQSRNDSLNYYINRELICFECNCLFRRINVFNDFCNKFFLLFVLFDVQNLSVVIFEHTCSVHLNAYGFKRLNRFVVLVIERDINCFYFVNVLGLITEGFADSVDNRFDLDFFNFHFCAFGECAFLSFYINQDTSG